jgi:hypothetical protein
MSKAVIGEHTLAHATDSRASDTPLVWSDGSFIDISATTDRERHSLVELDVDLQHSFLTSSLRSADEDTVSKEKLGKHRFGLPSGFVSRVGRYGRTVLFEDNVYRLPNGLEFIPQPPAGTLGSRNHQYALLTPEQFENGQRGSVYVHTDGRIFDYSFDHTFSERDLFDTGFTIHDLERTGRYAPAIKSRLESKRKNRNAQTGKKKRRSGRGK